MHRSPGHIYGLVALNMLFASLLDMQSLALIIQLLSGFTPADEFQTAREVGIRRPKIGELHT